jgi:hypothetical protein
MLMKNVEIVLKIDIIRSKYINKLINTNTPNNGTSFAIEPIISFLNK